MKKFIIIIICAIFLIETGCERFLEEDLRGKVLGNSVLSTQVGLESALTGAYKGLSWSWTMGVISAMYTEMTFGGEDWGNGSEFDVFKVTAENNSSATAYQGFYKTIQGANNVIANYQTTKGNSDEIQIIAGEAYFLRALSYFNLVRLFGDIPLVTSPDFSLDQYTMERTSVADIYKLIEDDLANAETMLADQKRDFGRPNRGSAKAVLADVYLTEAGWPLKDNSKYSLAAAKAKEVIDNHSIYGFELVPTFAELFKNDPATNGTVEDVFDVACNTLYWTAGNNLFGSWAMPGEMGGWNAGFAELNFFRDFPEGPRKDATFVYTYKKLDGTVVPWQELSVQHPFYKKLWIMNDVLNYESALPIVLMRYAHVLTIYAEAKARSGGPDALAYECINAIRERAGLEPFSGLSAEEFAASVVQERAWEFAAERTRWFDLVRLEMVAEANSHRDPAEPPIYKTITEADYIAPIPKYDALINPNLNK